MSQLSKKSQGLLKERESTMDKIKEDWGIVTDFQKLGPNAIISEEALAEMFSRCGTSIKRAIERNELPPSVRLLGKPCWTIGSLVAHIELRLEIARMSMESDKKRIEALCP